MAKPPSKPTYRVGDYRDVPFHKVRFIVPKDDAPDDPLARLHFLVKSALATPKGDYMKYICSAPGPEGPLDFYLAYYGNGRVAIKAESDQFGPWGTVSINVEDVALEDNEFVLNHDSMDDSIESYLATGLFEDTGKRVNYGFVEGQPVWKLTAKALAL